MTGIDNLAAQLQKTINEKDEGKKTGYDTQATVVKVSSDTIWVKIPGGVDETPVSKTVSAKEGDIVQVRVAGGRAWIVGNYTAPATDDTRAEEANTKAESADAHAAIAEVAAQGAQESAMTAQQAADVAKTRAIEAGKSAEEAKTMASEASAAAAKANTAANGAVTSLGIVQGVVDGLSVDMDEMQTHVAMMDAVVDPDSGKTLVPAGLHVVPTSNGYFVVLSNDGMYVYDNESDLVAIFGENIKFDSIRPQRIGGDDAYIEYYDSDNDGKADSLRIVGANISSSTGIPTKVSELQNDSGYTTKTYVDDAVGDTATDLANYILSNDKAIDDLERQIDGAIDTWYYAVDPTTSNEPAKDWTTEALKESHLRDLYFNTSNGHTWRWAKDGSTYKWIQIEDADAIKALADAAKAQTTANVKKRVFVTTPVPPYDVGDLWVGGSKGDIKKCKTAKAEGQSYAASDWELASKYTDDSSLNSYKTEVSNTYSTKVEVQQTESTLEGKITAAETSTKSYADGLIEQEVSDRNTAIQASADGITTSVSQNYTKTVDLANTDAVKAAKKAGTDAQSALNSYKTTNDAAVAAAKKAGDDAQADLDDYKDTVQETYATKTELTQTESSIKSEVSSTYATKSSVPTKVSQLTNDSKYATQTQAQGYANTAESNAKADATTKANAAEANAKADATTKANAAEANAKADTTEKLKSYSTTTQMNSAIEQKANSIALSVAQTEISKIEVGGRNLVTKEARRNVATDVEVTYTRGGRICATNIIFEDRALIGERVGDTAIPYAVENTDGAQVTLSFEYKLGDGGISRPLAIYPYQDTGLSTKANLPGITPTDEWQSYAATTNVYRWTTGDGSSKHGSSYTPEKEGGTQYRTNGEIWVWDAAGANSYIIRRVKIEKGNKATDWTPAPEDLEAYTDTQVSAAKAEIKVTTDGISSEVAKKVGASEIISKINQSAEGIQIEAKNIEFKGSVVFNAIKSQTDAAYDAKGSASVVQTNLDNLEVGGRNLARGAAEMIKGGGAWSTATWRDSGASNTYNYSVDDSPVASVSEGVLVTTKVAKTRYGVCQDGCPMLSKKITFSVWAKGTAGGTINLQAVWWSGIPSSANWSKNFTTTGAWQYISFTADLTNVTVPNGKCSICYMYWTGVNVNDTCIFIAPKLEYGAKATDWTPAPEDVDASIEDVSESAAEALASTSDAIYQKISDTDDEVATIQTNLAKYVNRTELNEVDAFVKKYLGDKGYVKVNNQGLVITQGQFSVVITGDRMIFQENGNSVAYLTNQKLFITKSEVTQEMKIANFVWSNRNGRLTLMLAE